MTGWLPCPYTCKMQTQAEACGYKTFTVKGRKGDYLRLAPGGGNSSPWRPFNA